MHKRKVSGNSKKNLEKVNTTYYRAKMKKKKIYIQGFCIKCKSNSTERDQE